MTDSQTTRFYAATVHLVVEAPNQAQARQAIDLTITDLMKAGKVVTFAFASEPPHKKPDFLKTVQVDLKPPYYPGVNQAVAMARSGRRKPQP